MNVIRLSPSWPLRAAIGLRRLVDRGQKLATSAPRWSWPLAVVLAAWPSLLWSARRLVDDSDDPLGIVALVALAIGLWHGRRRFGHAPRRGPLSIAAALVVVANLPALPLPDLVRALLVSVALVAALAAIADHDEPIVAYAGLAILALPLLSSLQFYAGFPLRVVTAEASRWLLAAGGFEVSRLGSALTVDGRLVLVDAACSGVKMAWVGYFTAFVTALLCRVPNRTALARLPLVGATVLVGNIVRNTLLVAAAARGVAMTDAMHAAVGLVVFGGVAGGIAWIFFAARPACPDGQRPVHVEPVSPLAPLLVAGALLVAAASPLASPAAAPTTTRAVEWPTVYDGRPLVPLALSPVEARFAVQFPGTIARFSNGARAVVLRDVGQATRRLHPAADCYRGLGYAIDGERLERDAEARLWRCFDATRADGRGLRVCERIVDADGQAYTDVSSWYWAAALARSRGPWQAVTVATPIGARS